MCHNQKVDKVQLRPWPLDQKCTGIFLSQSCIYVWHMKGLYWKLLNLSFQNRSVDKGKLWPWPQKQVSSSHHPAPMFEIWKLYWTRHVFEKQGCPRRQQSQNIAKISIKSKFLTPPHTQEHEMSVKCDQSLDERTVQVWLLYHHPNLKILHFVWKRVELHYGQKIDRRTGRQTNDPIIKWTFRAGGIKILKLLCQNQNVD